MRLAENSDLATVTMKIRLSEQEFGFDLDAVKNLEDIERHRIDAFHQALALRFDNTAFQHQSGYLSDADMELLMDGLPTFLALWKMLGVRINPALQRYIDTKELAT